MHCDRCVNNVTLAINKIDGASARVSLNKREAVVACDREIDTDRLKEAVEKAGYAVISVEE